MSACVSAILDSEEIYHCPLLPNSKPYYDQQHHIIYNIDFLFRPRTSRPSLVRVQGPLVFYFYKTSSNWKLTLVITSRGESVNILCFSFSAQE